MINAAFSEDHRRIDGLLVGLGDALGGATEAVLARAPALAGQFKAAASGLRRHIDWEEQLLFPAVERQMPDLAHGPGHVMREEHREILACLARLEDWFGTGDPDADGLPGARLDLAGLGALLADHNEKEETIYYPLADELLGPEDVQRILNAMGEAA